MSQAAKWSRLRPRIQLRPLQSQQFPVLAIIPSRSSSNSNMSSKAHPIISNTADQRDSQTLILSDGRTLGFAEYGSPTGKPVFFFHGFPSSRLEAAGILELVHRPDLRIIAPERPGFGLSSFNPRHRITDWPADVRALAGHLGIARFAVLGGSGGAPYALACARALPADTLSAVGLLAPAAPWTVARGVADVPYSSRIAALMAYYWPASLQLLGAGVVAICRRLAATDFVARRIDQWIETLRDKKNENAQSQSQSQSQTSLSPSPSPIAAQVVEIEPAAAKPVKPAKLPQETRAALLRSLFEPFSQGTAPLVREAQLLTWEGWGFLPEEVLYDRVLIWHGTDDTQSPIRIVRDLAARLPHCVLREFGGETHFTLVKNLGRILEELVPLEEGKGDDGEENEVTRKS
ncbi:Alpha/Beta hydrolase protein [Nemania sp. FL0031]|nr:Alpha/Beta hydrolase protein [Nemania sp. FL0031]